MSLPAERWHSSRSDVRRPARAASLAAWLPVVLLTPTSALAPAVAPGDKGYLPCTNGLRLVPIRLSRRESHGDRPGETTSPARTSTQARRHQASVPRSEEMLEESPRLFFMHFWANDDAVTLATGLRAAHDQRKSKKK